MASSTCAPHQCTKPTHARDSAAVWTSLPTILYALLEQDVPAHVVWANPGLYRETQQYSRREFFRQAAGWLGQGLWHGLMCYFVPYLTFTLGVSAGLLGAGGGGRGRGWAARPCMPCVVNRLEFLATLQYAAPHWQNSNIAH